MNTLAHPVEINPHLAIDHTGLTATVWRSEAMNE